MIYADHNATAPLLPEVKRLLREGADRPPGNPSSVHGAGRQARRTLEAARETVARQLGAAVKEVTFTGSGSEAAALAIKGAFFARKDPSRTRIVISSLEHPCVAESAAQLKRHGAQVVRIGALPDGRVNLEAFLAALDHQTAVASLMAVNNETGVLQPIEDVGRAAHAKGIVFHTDAVQAIGRVPISLLSSQADLLSISGHKFGAPQGIGALLSVQNQNLESLAAGHQENGRRGGTPAVLQCEALALALSLSLERLETHSKHLASLVERFERAVQAAIPGVQVNGTAPRAPGTSNLRFDDVDGEALLIALDLEGICASSGSACTSGTSKPSATLLAMGSSSEQAQASLRFSFGPSSSEADVDAIAASLEVLVPRVRQSNPRS